MDIREVILSVTTVLGTAIAVINKYRETITWVMLRIEKDAADGWTNEEKEQAAIDLYYEKARPTLPWYIQMIPRFVIEWTIRSVIKSICAKRKELKNA